MSIPSAQSAYLGITPNSCGEDDSLAIQIKPGGLAGLIVTMAQDNGISLEVRAIASYLSAAQDINADELNTEKSLTFQRV